MKKRWFLRMIAVGALFFSGCGKTVSDLPVSLDPPSATVKTGQQVQFQVIVDGSPYTTDLTWSANGIPGGNTTSGTISGTGLYTAPQTIPNPSTVTVSASQQGTSEQGSKIFVSVSAPVTVIGAGTTPSVSIHVSPSVIIAGQIAVLLWSSADVDACTVTDTSTNATIATGTSGSVQVGPSQTTTYQAACTGANGPASDSITLTVQSSGGGGGITVSITPTSGVIQSGGTLQFSAMVTNDALNKGVTWTATLGSPPAATDPLHATYTAPTVTMNTDVTITATSVADSTAFASATITVTPADSGGPPQAGISPPAFNLKPGASQLLTATITGSGVTSQAFTWSLQPAAGVNPADVGTIIPGNLSNTATYQAANVSSIVTVQIIATSVQFPNVAGYSTASVGP